MRAHGHVFQLLKICKKTDLFLDIKNCFGAAKYLKGVHMLDCKFKTR